MEPAGVEHLVEDLAFAEPEGVSEPFPCLDLLLKGYAV